MFDRPGRTKGRAPLAAQWNWELEELAKVYRRLMPKVSLEIGVYQGGTMRMWLRHACKGALVMGIDTNRSPGGLIIPDGVTHSHICIDSHSPEALNTVELRLAGRHIDFLFIDADHTEEGATLDFEAYGQLVRAGGVIAFHDILDPAPHRNQDHIRVSRLWRRIQQAGYLTQEFIADPAQSWGGIGVMWK